METRPNLKVTQIVRLRRPRTENLKSIDATGNTQKIILGNDDSHFLTPHPNYTNTESQELFYDALTGFMGGGSLARIGVGVLTHYPNPIPQRAMPGLCLGSLFLVVGLWWYLKTVNNLRLYVNTVTTVSGLFLGVIS